MINNIIFYIKNLVTKWHQTPKQIRNFTCFICYDNFIFPIQSKDFIICNDCFAGFEEE
jgi:protein-arginine kinase activator protein McsA